MKLQLIRNATLKLNYAGKIIIIDPMLSNKGDFESFAGITQNPIVDLQMSKNEILNNLDLVLVTHTHIDHFDPAAQQIIPKQLPLFCQPTDEDKIKASGFLNVIPIKTDVQWENIHIHRTGGKHGSGEVLKQMGLVSGFVLQSDSEPTVYIVGDSILVEEVKNVLHQFIPDIIITNSGGAYMPGYEQTPILMDEEQTLELVKLMPNSTVIAVHLEALDHCTVKRQSLREKAIENCIDSDCFLIPEDGQYIELNKK